MKKAIKNNKGFSMIELLVALLIMAVIAAIAITLYSGVLNSSKTSADRASAAEIKRQLLIYMNASNDMNLSEITDHSTGNKVVKALFDGITITGTPTDGDEPGKYGPYFEGKAPEPQAPGMNGWKIFVDQSTMHVTVDAAKDDTDGVCTVS